MNVTADLPRPADDVEDARQPKQQFTNCCYLFIYRLIPIFLYLLLELCCISVCKRCNIGGWMYVNATFAAAARRCARVRYEICVFVAVCTWLYNPLHVPHPSWKHTKTHQKPEIRVCRTRSPEMSRALERNSNLKLQNVALGKKATL